MIRFFDSRGNKPTEITLFRLSIKFYFPFFSPGVEQIVPVRGFFCKICLKFYYSEVTAKVTHCQSATHFEEYQVSTSVQSNSCWYYSRASLLRPTLAKDFFPGWKGIWLRKWIVNGTCWNMSSSMTYFTVREVKA